MNKEINTTTPEQENKQVIAVKPNTHIDNQAIPAQPQADTRKKRYPGKWYVVGCYSGQADKIAENIKRKVKTSHMEDVIFAVRVIKETVRKKRAKTLTTKNLYTGYLFINMIMKNRAWFLVRNTEGVTGFIGSSGKGTKPFPLPSFEAKKLLEQIEPSANENADKNGLYHADFNVNDFIKVNDSVFKGKEGQVISLDNVKGLATVNLEIFGRYTPTQIPYSNCEKIG